MVNTTLFDNYLYIILLLLPMYLIIKKYHKLYYIGFKHTIFIDFLKELDNYYVKDIFYELFILIFYFFCYILLFIFIRISSLGSYIDIAVLSINTLNYSFFINIILFIISINLYLNILNLLFFMHVIKLHFYLFKYQFYIDFVDFVRDKNNWLTLSILNFELFFYECTLTEQELKNFGPNCMENLNQINQIKKNRDKENARSILVHKYKILLYLCKGILFLLEKFNKFIDMSRFLKYVNITILIIVIIYDIFKCRIYFTYYAVLIFYIITWIQKSRKFFVEKDSLYDNLISEYFYGPSTEKMIKKHKRIPSENLENEETKRLLEWYEEIISYFKNNMNNNITDSIIKTNETCLNNIYKRIHLLIILFLGLIYFYYHQTKYIIIFGHYNVNVLSIFCILFLINYIIHKQIFYSFSDETHNKDFAEKNLYKIIFNIISIFSLILLLYLILKNKVTIYPDEIILNIKDIILVKEIFTIEEKYDYLAQYLIYLEKELLLDKEHSIIIRAKIIITENILLRDIPIMVNSMANELVGNLKKQITILDIILLLFKKVKSIFKS